MELVPDFLLRAGQPQPIAVGGSISTDSVAGGTVNILLLLFIEKKPMKMESIFIDFG